MEEELEKQPEPELQPEYERQPEPDLRKPEKETAFSASRLAGIAGMIVFLGAVAFGTTQMTQSTKTAISASSEYLSDTEAATIAQSFSDSTPLALPLVPESQQEQAIKNLELSPKDELKLRKELAAGITVLVSATFSDFLDADGDAITINSNIFSVDLVIQNDGYTIAIPVSVAASSFTVIGLTDGQGGGITLNVVTSSGGQVTLPRLAEGQPVTIPIAL